MSVPKLIVRALLLIVASSHAATNGTDNTTVPGLVQQGKPASALTSSASRDSLVREPTKVPHTPRFLQPTNANSTATKTNDDPATDLSRQIAWAADAVGKLESLTCKRKANTKSQLRKFQSMVDTSRRRRRWRRTYACSGDLQKIGLLCYEDCPSEYTPSPGGTQCDLRCGAGWEDTGFECRQSCDITPHLGHACGIYCAKNQGECDKKILDILANVFTGGLAGVIQQARKIQEKAEVVRSIVEFAKTYDLTSAKEMLTTYMLKDMGVPDETINLILEEGVQEFVAIVFADKVEGLAEEAALDMLDSIDPTGITAVVRSFGSPDCEDKVIKPMPQPA